MKRIMFAVAALAAMVASAQAQLVVGTCGTPPVTLTAGQQNVPLYLDVNGNLCVDVAVTIGDANITQWGGVAVGAMANYGTSPGAVKVPGVNAFVTNVPTVVLTAETTKVIGTVNQGTSPWVVSGTVQLAGQSYTNVSTDTDTVIKASAGTFAGLVVNTGGTASSVVVYDGATCTGTKIGTFSTLAQASLSFSVAATTGICVTTASTAGPADLTVLWR